MLQTGSQKIVGNRPPGEPRRRRAPLVAALLVVAATVAACAPETSDYPAQGPPIAVAGLRLVTPGTLTVGTDLHHPAEDFLGSDGRPTGLSVDLAAAMARTLGLGVRFVDDGFDRLLPDLTAGRFDVVVSHHVLSNPLTATASALPYLKGGLALVARPDEPFQPARFDQLCGHRVAVQAGSYAAERLAAEASLCGSSPPLVHATTTDPEALADLVGGGAEVQVTDSIAAGWESGHGPVVVPSGVIGAPNHVVLVRRDDSRVDLAVTAALGTLRSNGTYQYIIERIWKTNEVEL
jgi:polar amino acid transport system substrate-binding protein